MADYVWWFLLVGIVLGGAIVALLSIDFSRREQDIEGDEREAEATLIARQLAINGQRVPPATVAQVLQAHRDYRRLPPPDRFELAGTPDAAGPADSAGDGDPDGEADDVGDDRGGGADEDLAPA
jgi:hypothetical protein